MIQKIVGSIIPGLILLTAAFLKAVDLRSTLDAISWLGMTKHSLVAGIALVGVEAGLGTLLLLFAASFVWRLLAAILFAGFSVVIVIMFVHEKAPDCGCLGLTHLFQDRKSNLTASFGRNLMLLAGIAYSLSTARPFRTPAA